MEERLFERLEAYDDLGIYPCHMPGHKRQPLSNIVKDSIKMDITEIDGFDNLHHPTDIIQMEEKIAARIYGAKRSFFLVNGSTCGNMSAVSACVKRNGKILVARNCHKSVYNAFYFNECRVKYLIPEMIDEYEIVGGITPESVKEALDNDSDIQAVMITSPTYDGVISDIAGIASVVHRFGIPLIVDEAHGAHFGLDSSLPKNALENGADVVIHSLHKTLPSFTQTALLHVQGDIVDEMRIARFQSMYQSTSPSYLLLSSISKCLYYIENEAEKKIQQMNAYLDAFYDSVKECKILKVLDQSIIGKDGVFDFDRTKIIISTIKAPIAGEELYEYFLHKKKIQMEMVAPEYCQAIMTFMDTEEGFKRLSKAICEMDLKLQQEIRNTKVSYYNKNRSSLKNIYQKELIPEAKCTIYQAQEMEREWVELVEAKGRIITDYVMLYPPGIPILAPGEVVEEKHIDILKSICERNLNVLGIENGKVKAAKQ